MSAAAPATCGAAIDVPLRVRRAVSLDQVDDVMPTPGAKMSRQVPQLENDARTSAESTAPTVMASGALAGDMLHASAFRLPAATTNTIPSLMPRATAELNTDDLAPPRLRLATAGCPSA